MEDGGAAADGLFDLRCRLFDSAAGGVQVGPTMCVDNVDINNGLFTVQLDVGQPCVTTAQRHIEIELRCDSGLNCSNASGFTLLAPRQLLTATPLANHAKSAFALDAADGSPANAVFVDNSGNVGIGTSAPTHSVHIASPAPTLAIQDTDSTTQQVGYLSYRDSGNVERGWIGYGSAGDPDLSILNARANGDIVLNTLGEGRVGIGTAAPTAELHVVGSSRYDVNNFSDDVRIVNVNGDQIWTLWGAIVGCASQPGIGHVQSNQW
ncbi:MAG: hypothetical protein AB7Q17_07840 [Phycisphaerae bacterium]